MPGLNGQVRGSASGNQDLDLQEVKSGCYALDLEPGEQAVLWSGDQMPDIEISPLSLQTGLTNCFGLR